ncbi:MAG: Ig-like domain-containing protein, partial [bacterium]|nr:Ig-like domain-containing protein [bacterium]
MTTDELLEWIRQQLQAGFSEDDIKKTGLAGGWAGEDINEAFAIIEGSPPLTIAPMPEPPVMPAPPEEVPTAEESAVRVSEAEPTEDTATQAPQKRRWPLVAFAVCILLVGSAAAAFMLVPGVRSFVLGRAPVTALPTDKTLAPTSNIIADAPILLNPTESTSPSSPQKTPLSATVEPVITSPVKQGGITPPPSSVTAPSVDTTAPIVSLSAPASGATVSGSSVAVSASASDKVGVVSVQLKLDGSNLGSADTVAPYSVTWDTKKSVNGKHTLSATAKDAAGNIGTAVSVTVTVNNVISTPPPTVTTNPDTT